MQIRLILLFTALLIGLDPPNGVLAQATMGLLQHSSGSIDDGYVLFAPVSNTNTYLIDKCGNEVHRWPSEYRPGQSVYLLPDGHLLRTGNTSNSAFNSGGRGGIIEKIDWEGNVVWHYLVSDDQQCQHHDIRPLSNGNILVIAWEVRSAEEALAAGRTPNNVGPVLWGEKIIELAPMGTNEAITVWEWRAWDHLVQAYDPNLNNFDTVALHPELIHINETEANSTMPDWLHFNAIDYHEELDQILISVHGFKEIWIIDHSTTTSEAASHQGGRSGKGGDLLYRWGNPAAYDQGSPADQKFFDQHNAQWIPEGLANAGKILVFNNGANRPGGNYSSVEIINPPPLDEQGNYISAIPFLPLQQDWIYGDNGPGLFYSRIISGAQALKNGHFLICSGGDGRFFEIDANEDMVWEYINPVGSQGPASQGGFPSLNSVFRCTFYPSTYPGLANRALTPIGPIELNPIDNGCLLNTVIDSEEVVKSVEIGIEIFPNPANREVRVHCQQVFDKLVVRNSTGQVVRVSGDTDLVQVEGLLAGVYFFTFYVRGVSVTKRVVVY
ncbi:MAG: aryl-sulfate sulfotransferase [Saprospiraceae bacterium]